MRRFLSLFGPGNPAATIDFDALFPTQEELEEDPDFNRAFAVGMADDHTATILHNREVTSDLAKWVLTTLLAINAGALVGVSQLHLEPTLRLAAAAIFVIGLLLPLFSAHLSIRSSLELSFPLGEAQGYWRAVSHNGYRNREMELSQMAIIPKALALSKWPYRFTYASIACFIIGVGTAAAGLIG